MRQNALLWIIILTLITAIGITGLGLYMYIDDAIKGFFIS
jgi:hypothetical protein